MAAQSDGQQVYQLLADLLRIAYDGLQDTRLGIPDSAYLSHDEPPEDECCDFLALWVRDWTPYVAGDFPISTDFGERCRPLEWGPTVVLSLRRPCAPGLGSDRNNPFPEPDAEHAAAEDLIVDARTLLCVVTSDWQARLDVDYTMPRMSFESLQPTGGATNCFGWDWDIKLELPNSCQSPC